MSRVQSLLHQIDAHAARLEGAENGTVAYTDEELREIAESTGAVPNYSKEMSPERLRDAYCALVVRDFTCRRQTYSIFLSASLVTTASDVRLFPGRCPITRIT